MDRLVNLIACGVGSVKRKKRKPVRLVRLSLNRQSDAALSSDSDSSDEDYLPEPKYVNFFEKIYICNNFYVCLLVFFFHQYHDIIIVAQIAFAVNTVKTAV